MVQSLSGKFVNDCRLRVAMLDAVSSFRCWRTALEEDGEELRSPLKFLANRYSQGSGQHGENDGVVIVLKGGSSLVSISKAWPEQEFET